LSLSVRVADSDFAVVGSKETVSVHVVAPLAASRLPLHVSATTAKSAAFAPFTDDAMSGPEATPPVFVTVKLLGGEGVLSVTTR
jgi:hypothetical protein